MAADTEEYGVGVFAITPGLVDTPLARLTWESPAGRQWTGQYEGIYAERRVPPEFVAERCLERARGTADRLSRCYIQLADDLDDLVRTRAASDAPLSPRVARGSG